MFNIFKKFTKDGKEIKSVCAWCSNKEKKTKKWESKGYAVSHGICKKCSKKMNDDFNNN